MAANGTRMSEMTTSRLEAFSDGVIAVIITIMVLELRAPGQPTLAAVIKISPAFITYGLSFLVAAIMWINHHHLIHAVHSVTARLLWSNMNLLFWMSLVPFVTEFLAKNYREPLAVALYGLDLTFCSLGFYFLRSELVRQSRHDPAMTEYHQQVQRKNFFSGLLYMSSIPLAYVSIYASFLIFVLIPGLYFLPEKKLGSGEK
jgi:uncharacterized membrane protein